MSRFIMSMCLVALLSLFAAPSTLPAADDAAKTYDGKIVAAAEGKLVMTVDGQDEQMTFEVGEDAKITIDGKEAKFADLQAGYKAKVTVQKGKLTQVEAQTG